MSVVVWDGTTLAADRQATNSNLRRTMTKISRHGDVLIAGTGTQTSTQAVREWILEGAHPDKFPHPETDDNTAVWVINRNGTIVKFENSPFGIRYLDKVFAEGSGRDFALGAMSMGADAVAAVEVACMYDIYCGGGIDTLSFDD